MVKNPVFVLDSNENEVIVRAKGLSELEVKRRFGLALGKEGLKVIVEAYLRSPPPRKHRDQRYGREDPYGPALPLRCSSGVFGWRSCVHLRGLAKPDIAVYLSMNTPAAVGFSEKLKRRPQRPAFSQCCNRRLLVFADFFEINVGDFLVACA